MRLALAILVIALTFTGQIRSQERYRPTIEDFRSAKWGMTQEEVKVVESLELKAEDSEAEALFYRTEISNLAADVMYQFVDDRLVSAAYVFNGSHVNKNMYIDDMKLLKDLLTEKYGMPLGGMTWSSDLYKSDPTKYGQAVSIGHLGYLYQWSTLNTRTRIALSLRGDNFKTFLVIGYRAMDSLGMKRTKDRKKALDVL